MKKCHKSYARKIGKNLGITNKSLSPPRIPHKLKYMVIINGKNRKLTLLLEASTAQMKRLIQNTTYIFQVFDLRAHVCSDEDAWLEVVTEDLRLILPITPYRSFNPFDVVNNRLVLLGVDGALC